MATRFWTIPGFIGVLLVALALAAAGWASLTHGQAAAGPGAGVSLLMFGSPVCEYCELWEDEIGVVYAKTAEGRFAPLRRVGKQQARRSVSNLRAIVFTPTFVVVKDGREVGRITGYPGEDFFWPMLTDILERIGFRQPS